MRGLGLTGLRCVTDAERELLQGWCNPDHDPIDVGEPGLERFAGEDACTMRELPGCVGYRLATECPQVPIPYCYTAQDIAARQYCLDYPSGGGPDATMNAICAAVRCDPGVWAQVQATSPCDDSGGPQGEGGDDHEKKGLSTGSILLLVLLGGGTLYYLSQRKKKQGGKTKRRR